MAGPGELDLTIYEGDDFALVLQFQDEQAVSIDLSQGAGYDEFTAEIRKSKWATSPAADFTVDTTDAEDGIIRLYLSHTQTVDLPHHGEWELRATLVDGQVHTLLAGKARLTHEPPVSGTEQVTVQMGPETVIVVSTVAIGPPGPPGDVRNMPVTWIVTPAFGGKYHASSVLGTDSDRDVTLLVARLIASLAPFEYVGSIEFHGSTGDVYQWGNPLTGVVPTIPAGVGGSGPGRLVISADPSATFQLTADCPRLFNPPATTPDLPLTVRNVTFDGIHVDRAGLPGSGFHHVIFGSTKPNGGTYPLLSFEGIRVNNCGGRNCPIDPTNHNAPFWFKFDIFFAGTTLAAPGIPAHSAGDVVTVPLTDGTKLPTAGPYPLIVDGEKMTVTGGYGTNLLTATAQGAAAHAAGVEVVLNRLTSATDIVARDSSFVGGNAGLTVNGSGGHFDFLPLWIDEVLFIDCEHDMRQYPSGNQVLANGPLKSALDNVGTDVEADHFVEYPATDGASTWTITIDGETMTVVAHAAASSHVTVTRGGAPIAHPAGTPVVTPAFGANFHLAQDAPGGRAAIVRCRGFGSGDVAFEVDNLLWFLAADCIAEEAQGFAYLAANFVTPKDAAGNPRTASQRFEYRNCRYVRKAANQGYAYVLNHPNASIPFGSLLYTDCSMVRTTADQQWIGEAFRMFSAARSVVITNPKITIDGMFSANPVAPSTTSFIYVNGPSKVKIREVDLVLVADHDPTKTNPSINLIEVRGDSQLTDIDIDGVRFEVSLSNWHDNANVPFNLNLLSILSGQVTGKVRRIDLAALPASGSVTGIVVAASPGLTIPTQLELDTAGLRLLTPAKQLSCSDATNLGLIKRTPLLNLDESTPGAETLWVRLASGAWVPQQRRLDPPVVFTGTDPAKRILSVQPAAGQSVNQVEFGAATLLSDTFTEPDGTLLTAHTADTGQGPWTATNWAPQIVGGAVVTAGGAVSTDQYALVDAHASDGVLTATITLSPTSAEAGVLFRASDANNWLSVDLTLIPGASVNQLRLWKRTGGGAGVTLASVVGVCLAGANSILVSMIGDAISVYLNGVKRIAYTLTTAELVTFGALTKIGWKAAVRAGADDGTTTLDSLLFAIPAWSMDRNGLIHAQAGVGQPVRSGLGKTKLSNDDFPPGSAFDGLAGPVRDTATGKSYWSWRDNGVWLSIEGG